MEFINVFLHKEEQIYTHINLSLWPTLSLKKSSPKYRGKTVHHFLEYLNFSLIYTNQDK